MKLIVINKSVRDKIRGTWKQFNILEPVEIVKDTWYIISLDAIKRIKPFLKDIKYLDITKKSVAKFTIGDGSIDDGKYQKYLLSQKNIDDFIKIKK